MHLKVNTSLDISKEEEDYLRSYFPKESFEIDKSIFTPGIDSTYLILNFVLGSLVGHALYDLFKKGVKKIYQEHKNKAGREITITIKHTRKFYRIRGEEVSKMEKGGTYINLNKIDDLFTEIEKCEVVDEITKSKSLISEGKTDLAFEQISQMDAGLSIENEIILLKSRYSTNSDLFRKNLIATGEYNREISKINNSILLLLEKLESA